MGAAGGPKVILTDRITHHDSRNANMGSRFSKDLSGQGRDCSILNGAAYSSSTNAIEHDGLNDMTVNYNVTSSLASWTPGGAAGTTTQTLEMWVKTSDGSGVLYTKPWNGSGRYNVWIFPGSFYLLTGTGVSLGPDRGVSFGFDKNLADGQWHQVACWMDSVNMGYYIDGGKWSGQQAHGCQNFASDYGDVNLPQGYMTLYPYGSGWGGNTGFGIQGSLAIFRHYSRVLTSAEVLNNFSAHRGYFGI